LALECLLHDPLQKVTQRIIQAVDRSIAANKPYRKPDKAETPFNSAYFRLLAGLFKHTDKPDNIVHHKPKTAA
jgi:hypothetical protein